MTKDQYRTALDALGLTQTSAAQFLGISIRSAHSYAHGREIPTPIAKLLDLMVRFGIKPEHL